MNIPATKGYRIARNCVEAEFVIPARCPCCSGIKLLLVDNQDRIRAIASISADELERVVAESKAGTLEPFSPVVDSSFGVKPITH